MDRRLDSRKQERLKPEYLALDPNAAVPMLAHDGIPIVDACYLPIVDPLDDPGCAGMRENGARPSVATWHERVGERPSYSETRYPGSRLSAGQG